MNLSRYAILTFAISTTVIGMHAAESATDSSAVRLEEVEVIESRSSALTQAVTESKLEVLQPQSIINLPYISNSVAPTADYATIANIAPSVANVETNGPGLSESKHLTLRGLDDGNYNVTMDGIPFGDYNTYTHHTTSYFPAKLIGQVVVDRGPGTASTIGNSTFGGTLAMYSKDPRSDLSFIPTVSYGSWNTRLYHYEANSGLLSPLNNASLIASFQHIDTDGFRTNSDMKRDTYYLKYLQPIGKDTVITFMGSYNNIHFSNPSTVTQQQEDFYGRNFGLTNNALVPPGAPAGVVGSPDTLSKAYNFQDKQADFEYFGFKSGLSNGWKVDNKVYTYFYNNDSHESPKDLKLADGTYAVLGAYKVNRYRTYGDTFVLSNESTYGTFKTGVWFDYTKNLRYSYGLNYNTNGENPITDESTVTVQNKPVAGNIYTQVGAPYYNYKYRLVDHDTTNQYFAEYDWHTTDKLTINAGIKYFSVNRDIDAPVLQTSARQTLIANHKDDKYLPFLSANYLITKDWSVYAQFAEGLQSPSEANTFYVSTLSSNVVKPQESKNYQLGSVFKKDRFNADVDVYLIDFSNYQYSAGTSSTGDPIYYGVAKGAYYYGLEAQATYYLGQGLSLYANGSINKAYFKGSNMEVPTVPNSTAALGFVYDKSGFIASFTEKYIGSWAVYDTITNPDIGGAGASREAYSSNYWLGDASIGYGFKFNQGFIHSVKIRLQVSNLFDKKVQVLDKIGASAAAAYTTDAFNVLPGRSYFLTVSADF